MECEYKGYRILGVYRNIGQALRKEIVDLWVGQQVLTPVEANRRVDEAVFIIRNPQGQLAGVNTAYIADFLQNAHPYYFLRMFFRPMDRGIPGLRRFASRKVREFLKHYPASDIPPQGVIIVTENPKF